jgi:putative membrane protein
VVGSVYSNLCNTIFIVESIYTYWEINWQALLGLALLCILYYIYHSDGNYRWLKPFVAAMALLIICFFSPLQILSKEYLFSAHMVVHVLLLLVIGPLLVLSLYKEESNNAFINNISRRLFERPVIGWLVGVGIMWFWHIPHVFNYCMNAAHASSDTAVMLHTLESGSLLVAGMLFSWNIISPVKRYRLSALNGVAYLFTACIGCSLLGLLITFAPAGTYRHFLSGTDVYHLNDVILTQWQINQTMDQQIAGLIMWVPCCLLYVVYALYLLVNWFNEKDTVAV